MTNIIVELSKYTILTLMVLYTVHGLVLLRTQEISMRKGTLHRQQVLIFFLDTVSFLVIWLKTRDVRVIICYVIMMAFFILMLILYARLYKNASILLLNNTGLLLSIGFIMLCRLDVGSALRQLVIAAGASILFLLVPLIIRRMRSLKKLTWLYAGLGVILLLAVLLLAQTSYGARLSLMGIQPSEAIKITFVFFMASILWRHPNRKNVALATIVAALHVGILVLSRDLGSASIFFVTWLLMLYTATRKPLFLAIGAAGGSAAAVVAYQLFGHVRQRVSAWKNPMAVYENEGYQIVQSLFAIGTGGWFGMGLCQGSPEKIPVVKNDFIFSAICEEMGAIFAICLILVCITFFLLILNISLQIRSPFYKLIALGLGTEYAVQVFLTIGGATKFIPLTGVTLPLISYGGSSLVSTLLMLSVIQGLYIYREDEDEEIQRLRRAAAQEAQRRQPVFTGTGKERGSRKKEI